MTDEDIISYALFPQSTEDVLKLKEKGDLERVQNEIHDELTSYKQVEETPKTKV